MTAKLLLLGTGCLGIFTLDFLRELSAKALDSQLSAAKKKQKGITAKAAGHAHILPFLFFQPASIPATRNVKPR